MAPARKPDSPPSAGRALLALVAIPVVSVSGVALVSDVASSTDPGQSVAAVVAIVGGLVMGLLVRRLVVGVWRTVQAARAWVQRLPLPSIGPVIARAVWAPVLALPAPIPVRAWSGAGRRGPPSFLR